MTRPSELEGRVDDALYSKSPEDDSALRVDRFGSGGTKRIRYFLYADVLGELVKAAEYRDESAVAVLLGQFCIDKRGPFVEISAFRDLEYLYGDDGIELLIPAVRGFFEEMEGGDDGEQLVGVFVGRPNSQALLDEEAGRLHLSLFNRPFQVVLMVDGVDRRVGLYSRKNGSPFVNEPLYVVQAAPPDIDGDPLSSDSGEASRNGVERTPSGQRDGSRRLDDDNRKAQGAIDDD